MEMVGGKRSYIIRGRSRPYYPRRCKTPPYIESLTDDLLSEILVRVPAEDLHKRAKLVCRKWSRIISSVSFANTHLLHASYGLVIFLQGTSPPIYVSTTKQGQIEVSRFGCKWTTRASFHGLILRFQPLCILNPTTKKVALLPSFPESLNEYIFCGDAYIVNSMEYKLVYMHAHQPTRHLAILSIGVDNSWRQLQIDQLPGISLWSHFERTGLVTEGFIHLVSENCREVLSLDMETEIIRHTTVPKPACPFINRFCYLSTGKNLSVLFRGRYPIWEIWEMIPEAGEWRKRKDFEFSLERKEDHGLFWPYGWVKYLEVLACRIGIADTLIFYNLRTHEIDATQLHNHNKASQPFPHQNTLL